MFTPARSSLFLSSPSLRLLDSSGTINDCTINDGSESCSEASHPVTFTPALQHSPASSTTWRVLAVHAAAAALPLSLSLALLLGEDARALALVTDGGVRPGAAARAWARELQPGAWFTLDHNSAAEPVQYVWRSEGRHLHLFMARRGRCVLFQAGRLAAYLQAGLMVPGEDEALPVRATRDALAKLDANPERLLV